MAEICGVSHDFPKLVCSLREVFVVVFLLNLSKLYHARADICVKHFRCIDVTIAGDVVRTIL